MILQTLLPPLSAMEFAFALYFLLSDFHKIKSKKKKYAQVALFNIQGQWAQLHGNPMVTFACATDEIEDIIDRYGRRR